MQLMQIIKVLTRLLDLPGLATGMARMDEALGDSANKQNLVQQNRKRMYYINFVTSFFFS